MPEYKQVTLKDPVSGDYLVPRVYGTLAYQIVDGQSISPFQPLSEIPSGIITLWSGSADAIPTGWHLCDGQEGTPDLRDRFIVGAGDEYTVGTTGGEKEHTLTINEMPSHSHTAALDLSNLATNSSGDHVHEIYNTTIYGYPSSGEKQLLVDNGSTSTYIGTKTTAPGGGLHTHTISGSGSVTIGNTGSGQAHENRPPYYALCYIMKL